MTLWARAGIGARATCKNACKWWVSFYHSEAQLRAGYAKNKVITYLKKVMSTHCTFTFHAGQKAGRLRGGHLSVPSCRDLATMAARSHILARGTDIECPTQTVPQPRPRRPPGYSDREAKGEEEKAERDIEKGKEKWDSGVLIPSARWSSFCSTPNGGASAASPPMSNEGSSTVRSCSALP